MGHAGGRGGKKLVWWQLAFITFVFTSAGPFGMEACVRSAGPLLTFFLILRGEVIWRVNGVEM